ncbi:hypothetical protein EV714DRAFT_277549 [Schizophyllum commune]
MNFFGRASLGVILSIFEECGLTDLVTLREVCSDFKEALDSNQSVWANVRAKMLNMPPPPLDSHGTRREEHAWAVHVLTSTGYLRSPTCEKLLRVHVRDLEVVNYTTWKAALPTIDHELGLISSCDPNRVPRGFQFFPDDCILCPACHTDSEAARQYAVSLTSFAERREWFKKNTIQVRSIYVHYRDEHKDLVAHHGIDIIPAINCYARCAICQHLSMPANEHPWSGSIYTFRDLRVHYERCHGVLNPGPVDHPLNSIEIESRSENEGRFCYGLRPRVL